MRFPSLHTILFGLLMAFVGIASAQTIYASHVAQGNTDAEEPF